MVKRVIAVGGDIIEGRDGKVFVNGAAIEEPYVIHRGGHPPEQLIIFGPLNVPTHQLFVMGDNRDVSYDSRMREHGFVDEKDVLGKPVFVLSSEADRVGQQIR